MEISCAEFQLRRSRSMEIKIRFSSAPLRRLRLSVCRFWRNSFSLNKLFIEIYRISWKSYNRFSCWYKVTIREGNGRGLHTKRTCFLCKYCLNCLFWFAYCILGVGYYLAVVGFMLFITRPCYSTICHLASEGKQKRSFVDFWYWVGTISFRKTGIDECMVCVYIFVWTKTSLVLR